MFSSGLQTTIVCALGPLGFESYLQICLFVNLISHDWCKLALSLASTKCSNLQFLLIVIGHVLDIHILLHTKFSLEALNSLAHLKGCIHWQCIALVLCRIEDADVVVAGLRLLLDVRMHATRLVLQRLECTFQHSLFYSSRLPLRGRARLVLLIFLVQVKLHLGELFRRWDVIREANQDWLFETAIVHCVSTLLWLAQIDHLKLSCRFLHF